MEPKNSLPHLRQPATFLYPKPDRSSSCPSSHFSEIHFTIILPSKPGSSKWSPSLGFPHQNPPCTSLLSLTCYMSCPFQSSRVDHPNDTWWALQSVKLIPQNMLKTPWQQWKQVDLMLWDNLTFLNYCGDMKWQQTCPKTWCKALTMRLEIPATLIALRYSLRGHVGTPRLMALSLSTR